MQCLITQDTLNLEFPCCSVKVIDLLFSCFPLIPTWAITVPFGSLQSHNMCPGFPQFHQKLFSFHLTEHKLKSFLITFCFTFHCCCFHHHSHNVKWNPLRVAGQWFCFDRLGCMSLWGHCVTSCSSWFWGTLGSKSSHSVTIWACFGPKFLPGHFQVVLPSHLVHCVHCSDTNFTAFWCWIWTKTKKHGEW